MLLLLVLFQVALAPPFQAAPDSDPKALLFYVDSAPAPSRPKPLALLSLQPPLQVLDKQVAEQQVLYEFQQTPTNSVSNVHVKQLFQPPGAPERAQLVAQGTQVLPRQTPGRFVYLNGRPGLNQSPIVSEDRVNPGSVYHQRVYHNQQKIPLLTYGPRAQQAPRNTFFASAPRAAPQRQIPSLDGGFQPPHQLQQIDRPSAPPQTSEEELEDEEEEEAEEEEDDVPENLEEDEDEDNKEDNSDVEAEEEPEDDEEEEKESSEEHFFSPRPKFRKFRYESDKDDAEDTDESKQSVKYQQPPQKKAKKQQKKSKRAGPGPEGGYSHQVPVTHKQKIYKESWYVSKDLEGAASHRLS